MQIEIRNFLPSVNNLNKLLVFIELSALVAVDQRRQIVGVIVLADSHSGNAHLVIKSYDLSSSNR